MELLSFIFILRCNFIQNTYDLSSKHVKSGCIFFYLWLWYSILIIPRGIILLVHNSSHSLMRLSTGMKLIQIMEVFIWPVHEWKSHLDTWCDTWITVSPSRFTKYFEHSEVVHWLRNGSWGSRISMTAVAQYVILLLCLALDYSYQVTWWMTEFDCHTLTEDDNRVTLIGMFTFAVCICIFLKQQSLFACFTIWQQQDGQVIEYLLRRSHEHIYPA